MRNGPHLILFFALALISGAAHGIFKCTDAKGNVTYSGTPCPTTTAEKALDDPVRSSGVVRGGQGVDDIMANPDLSDAARFSAAASKVVASKKIGEASVEQSAACFARHRDRLADSTAAHVMAASIYRHPAGETFVAVDVSVRDAGIGADRVWFLCALPK
jgi:hypothetical protein